MTELFETESLVEQVETFTKLPTVLEREVTCFPAILEAVKGYEKAFEAVREMMLNLLQMELATYPELEFARCSLRIPPDGIAHIDYYPLERGNCEGDCSSCTLIRGTQLERVETPIGMFDEFVWLHMRDFNPNPIFMFYRHLASQANQLRRLMKKHGIIGSFVTDEILEEHGIWDPLGIHTSLDIWCTVSKYLNKVDKEMARASKG